MYLRVETSEILRIEYLFYIWSKGPEKNSQYFGNLVNSKWPTMYTLCKLFKIQQLAFKYHVPGTEVPKATKAIALTESLRKIKQPKWPATSPMTAVQRPIIAMEITKQG